MPEWANNLQRVAYIFPEWQPFVSAWPKLTEMYERALGTNGGREMYDFMQILRTEE